MKRFEEFLTERKYLKNVSDKTLVYYRSVLRSREAHSEGDWDREPAQGRAFRRLDQHVH
jgi:hypothetical protein